MAGRTPPVPPNETPEQQKIAGMLVAGIGHLLGLDLDKLENPPGMMYPPSEHELEGFRAMRAQLELAQGVNLTAGVL